jgi:hypothetical protein
MGEILEELEKYMGELPMPDAAIAQQKCAKCGAGEPMIRYHATGSSPNGCGYFAAAHDYKPHLHLTCRTCLAVRGRRSSRVVSGCPGRLWSCRHLLKFPDKLELLPFGADTDTEPTSFPLGITDVGVITAATKTAAIRTAVEKHGAGTYVAVTERSWKPQKVTVEQTTVVKVGDA